MQRREFISLIGGSAVAWPLAARAQQSALAARAQQPATGKWRIGLLMQDRRQNMLQQGLRELGYVEGDNLVIEARSNDRADLLPISGRVNGRIYAF